MIRINVGAHRACEYIVAVRRDGVLLTCARAYSVAEAVKEAARGARMAMRLERDERARLALGRNAAMAELDALSGRCGLAYCAHCAADGKGGAL